MATIYKYCCVLKQDSSTPLDVSTYKPFYPPSRVPLPNILLLNDLDFNSSVWQLFTELVEISSHF